MERLTKWEGFNVDGTPRAVLVKREGLFADILQPALAKLASYEDAEEQIAEMEAKEHEEGHFGH